jgi:hypothetical protein
MPRQDDTSPVWGGMLLGRFGSTLHHVPQRDHTKYDCTPAVIVLQSPLHTRWPPRGCIWQRRHRRASTDLLQRLLVLLRRALPHCSVQLQHSCRLPLLQQGTCRGRRLCGPQAPCLRDDACRSGRCSLPRLTPIQPCIHHCCHACGDAWSGPVLRPSTVPLKIGDTRCRCTMLHPHSCIHAELAVCCQDNEKVHDLPLVVHGPVVSTLLMCGPPPDYFAVQRK